METQLINILRQKNISDNLIDKVINSGYIIRHWMDFKTPEGYITVSDKMYGNKQFSSSFDIDKFIDYIKGKNVFEKLPDFTSYTVRSLAEIQEILNVYPRNRYIDNGQMSFRGQVKEYTFSRQIPNPLRSDKNGNELSILPGAFRDKPLGIDENPFRRDFNTVELFLNELEPNNPNIFLDSSFAYDIMRVEQHYAKHTQGLDISFDIKTALFFATNKLKWNEDGTAYHSKVEKGEHNGVIYCFVFRDPPVKKTEFLIREFDLFKTYKPTRILRQNCGLPLFSDYDRNIAICDIDCIIYLAKDFDYETGLTPSHMFPNEKEDLFYAKLIELKKKKSHQLLENIVEYRN
ncbi:hypothetical protein [Fluviicola sp.]|uniref:hypothetical protein n=1 Tax=Fluviicola sp. TaxID=1917219 RepID=UPI003D2A1BC3